MEINLRGALEQNGAKLDDSQLKFIVALETEMRSALSKQNDALSEIITKKLDEAPNIGEELREELRSLATKLDLVEKSSIPKLSDNQKSQLRSYVKENHDEICKAIREGKEMDLRSLFIGEVRAAAPHLNSNGTVTLGVGVSAPTVENYDESNLLATIRYPEQFILGKIRNLQVAKVLNTRFKYEQAPVEGAVAVVAEAGEKPLIQYKWVKNALSRKKYAGRIEWSEEFEMDNDRLFMAIVQMIEKDVIRAWHNGIITDITANAVAYTTSPQSGTVPVPNAGDVAVVLQGLISAQNYSANLVLVNPATLVTLMLTKKTDGEYISTPFFKDGLLNGMEVIGNNVIPAGTIVVLDSGIYSENHTGVINRIGTYNDQFITNEKTMVSELFSMLEVAQIDLVASRKGTIATIIADITKP